MLTCPIDGTTVLSRFIARVSDTRIDDVPNTKLDGSQEVLQSENELSVGVQWQNIIDLRIFMLSKLSPFDIQIGSIQVINFLSSIHFDPNKISLAEALG